MPEPSDAEVRNVRVAAHSIMLPRGRFCISVAEVTPGIPDASLPGLAVSAIPGDGSQVEVARFDDTQWLRRPGDAVLLRVLSAQARILLTSYNMADAAEAKPPRMQIQRLDQPDAQPAAPAQAPAAPAVQAPPPAPAPAGPTDVMVHLARLGDRPGGFDEWLGVMQQGVWIEGLQIAPPPGLQPEELEYQVVLGKGWTSPWSQGGEFCGSRGMTLPVQGLRVALRGAAAKRFEVQCEAETVDGLAIGPVGSDELCGTEEPQPLARIRLRITPRTATRRGIRR